MWRLFDVICGVSNLVPPSDLINQFNQSRAATCCVPGLVLIPRHCACPARLYRTLCLAQFMHAPSDFSTPPPYFDCEGIQCRSPQGGFAVNNDGSRIQEPTVTRDMTFAGHPGSDTKSDKSCPLHLHSPHPSLAHRPATTDDSMPT